MISVKHLINNFQFPNAGLKRNHMICSLKSALQKRQMTNDCSVLIPVTCPRGDFFFSQGAPIMSFSSLDSSDLSSTGLASQPRPQPNTCENHSLTTCDAALCCAVKEAQLPSRALKEWARVSVNVVFGDGRHTQRWGHLTGHHGGLCSLNLCHHMGSDYTVRLILLLVAGPLSRLAASQSITSLIYLADLTMGKHF